MSLYRDESGYKRRQSSRGHLLHASKVSFTTIKYFSSHSQSLPTRELNSYPITRTHTQCLPAFSLPTPTLAITSFLNTFLIEWEPDCKTIHRCWPMCKLTWLVSDSVSLPITQLIGDPPLTLVSPLLFSRQRTCPRLHDHQTYYSCFQEQTCRDTHH